MILNGRGFNERRIEAGFERNESRSQREHHPLGTAQVSVSLLWTLHRKMRANRAGREHTYALSQTETHHFVWTMGLPGLFI